MQRYTISSMYEQKFSTKQIAKTIGVHETTVRREIKRNRDPVSGKYDASVAQQMADKRWRSATKHRKLDDKMLNLITSKLSLDFSPEQIAGLCKKEGIDCVSHETIYKLVWKDKADGGTMYTHLRRRGRRNKKRGAKYAYRGLIPNRVDIDERPAVVDLKNRFGDLEGDLIVGKNHDGFILTLNDRMTGFSWAAKLETKQADCVANEIVKVLTPWKPYLKTLTFDNGREFAHHDKVSASIGIPIFFAHPYHSWERGANENTNGLYRQYFPKGSDFNQYTNDDVCFANLLINNRPRKRLNFSSPIQEINRIFAPEFILELKQANRAFAT